MKITVSTNQLKSMLKVMDKIKDKELTKFSDILVKTNGGDSQFIKTNDETTIVYNCKYSVEDDGQVIIPLETMKLIKKIKENSVTITDKELLTDRKKISYKAEESATINTYENIEKVFEVSQRELLRMLEVTYAVAQDNTRPILTGVCFNKNETCTLDGFRLSLRKSREYENNFTFIVNQYSIEILKSILSASDDIVEVYFNGTDMTKFVVGDTIVIAKCLEGEFIKYNSIISNEYFIKSTVKANELFEEIDFIRNADKSNVIKTIFTDNHKLILKGNQTIEKYSEELSNKKMNEIQKQYDAEYEVKLKQWQQKGRKGKAPERKIAKFKKVYDNIPMAEINSEINAINELDNKDTFEIAYNPRYMAEALKLYDENVELRMTSCVNPIVVTEDIDKGLELVLPVRIR